jgi:inner membrane protein
LPYFCFIDSLTQNFLGTADGEISLGKKIGNKALLSGAIGGIIKDLDVFIGKLLYTNKI